MRLAVRPLTKARWDDLVDLFNRRGGSIVRGCWCMYYRRSGGSGLDQWGEANKRAMKALVDGGTVPGLIAYIDKRPVGWISLGPRKDYLRKRPRYHKGIAAGRDRLRPLERRHAARGVSAGQESAESTRLHVVRSQKPVRSGRLQGGRPPKGDEAGRAPGFARAPESRERAAPLTLRYFPSP